MVLGDSITQFGNKPSTGGWSATLQFDYVRSVDVINRGVSGWNTRQYARQALPVIIAELKSTYSPIAITGWFGVNDATLPNGPNHYQHIPIDEYKDNLRFIVSELQRHAPNTTVILITPPVIDEDARRSNLAQIGKPTDPLDRTNNHVGLYAVACAEVATSMDGVALLDIYKYFMETYPNANDRKVYFEDGLHLNSAGNLVLTQRLTSTLESLFTPAYLRKSRIG